MATSGLHHVTVMAKGIRPNLAFYTDALGLRLVKRTVNFDDPSVHHLYYGDRVGSPGSILTFFPYPRIALGRRGAGEVAAIALGVPRGALRHWEERLRHRSIETISFARFGRSGLAFHDHDGTSLEIIEEEKAGDGPAPPWAGHPQDLAVEMAIRGLHSATVAVTPIEPTRDVLRGLLGFEEAARDASGRVRMVAEGRRRSCDIVDLTPASSPQRPRLGAGSAHHIAFRTDSRASLLALRQRVKDAGLAVTPVRDRIYFESIYFREPGGALFEVATDSPGFTRDEPEAALGTSLRLPPWLEPRRGEIERDLPPLA